MNRDLLDHLGHYLLCPVVTDEARGIYHLTLSFSFQDLDLWLLSHAIEALESIVELSYILDSLIKVGSSAQSIEQ